MTNFDESQHPRAQDGTFTEKHQSSPEVALAVSDPEPLSARHLGTGDVVDMQMNRSPSPFDWHFDRNRAFRTAWKEAGRPRELTVVSTRADPEEPSDIIVTFQLGDGEFDLSFHRERELVVAKATS